MNVIQLNTVNLGGDIVVKKSEGGGTNTPSNDGWEYYKVDSSFYPISEEDLRAEANKISGMTGAYYMSAIVEGMLILNGFFAYGNEMVGFKVKGDGEYYKIFSSMGVTSFKALNDEALMGELGGSALNSRFIDALTPCTKEEFESLITE